MKAHGGSKFRECERCGYGQLEASGREDYWAAGHQSNGDDSYWTGAKQNYFDSALALLSSMSPGRRLLDLGGGLGFFTERALARGWDAYSLDVSPTVAERAAERIGPERSLTEVPEPERSSFDVLTMWCVVAHTRDPDALVRAARDALAPEGVLWATTPNFSFQKPYAATRKLLGRELDFGREDHVGHFTPRALKEMLVKGGFGEVRFQFRGITETCVAAQSGSRFLVEGKRRWNQLTAALLRLDVNLMSELQVTARRRETPGAGQ